MDLIFQNLVRQRLYFSTVERRLVLFICGLAKINDVKTRANPRLSAPLILLRHVTKTTYFQHIPACLVHKTVISFYNVMHSLMNIVMPTGRNISIF